MKTLINKAILTAIALPAMALTSMAQQSFSYSQYMNNLTPINSAYSLLDKAGNINLIGRKQWAGIDGAPSTFILNGSLPISSFGGSAGLIIMNDNYGSENITEANAFIAKAVRLSDKSYFSTSLNVGLRNFKTEYAALNPLDPKFNNSDVNETKANVGLGLMIHSDTYYVGVSLPRFNLSKVDKDNRFYKNTYYFSAGYLAALGKDFKLKPAALVAYAGNNIPTQFDVSTTIYVKEMYGFGVNYRSNNELAGILSYVLNKNLQLGYSYQFGFGTNRIGGLQNSTHEITLGYRFGKTVSPKLL